MLSHVLVVTLAGLSCLASAQNSTVPPGDSSDTIDYPYADVNPGDFPIALRTTWCNSQNTNCNLICGSGATKYCHPDDLSWSCVCLNGNAPNFTEYINVVPFYECQAFQGNCFSTNAMNLTAQQACSSIQCGSIDPATLSTAAPTSSSAVSTTSDSGNTMTTTTADSSTPAAASPSPSSTGAAQRPALQAIATGAFAAAAFGAVGLAI